jgi:hypothetical protein
MPLLKLNGKIDRKALTVKLPTNVLADLKAYSQFSAAPANEVASEALAYVFAKDSDFQKWKQDRDNSSSSSVA